MSEEIRAAPTAYWTVSRVQGVIDSLVRRGYGHCPINEIVMNHEQRTMTFTFRGQRTPITLPPLVYDDKDHSWT